MHNFLKVFSKYVWVGTKEENPDGIELPIPKDISDKLPGNEDIRFGDDIINNGKLIIKTIEEEDDALAVKGESARMNTVPIGIFDFSASQDDTNPVDLQTSSPARVEPKGKEVIVLDETPNAETTETKKRQRASKEESKEPGSKSMRQLKLKEVI